MANIEQSDILNSIHNLVCSAKDLGQINNQKENDHIAHVSDMIQIIKSAF